MYGIMSRIIISRIKVTKVELSWSANKWTKDLYLLQTPLYLYDIWLVIEKLSWSDLLNSRDLQIFVIIFVMIKYKIFID